MQGRGGRSQGQLGLMMHNGEWPSTFVKRTHMHVVCIVQCFIVCGICRVIRRQVDTWARVGLHGGAAAGSRGLGFACCRDPPWPHVLHCRAMLRTRLEQHLHGGLGRTDQLESLGRGKGCRLQFGRVLLHGLRYFYRPLFLCKLLFALQPSPGARLQRSVCRGAQCTCLPCNDSSRSVTSDIQRVLL